ncbi:MAG: DUF4097 family beta strand repeat-containing protein [Staphylococcus rostri]|uniref:DUF4097 family beta strand repeat-containing protein n=1 Tax=Staphylococcus rostri TaxID=522262 RepID=UPI0026E0AA31|nr:DUF4097 family beta strand repeat-containing protein [Staphylococcus rostri]MDO5376423.1 DUF4097 family beta strand repeat-containing protein [Staphylococcus rostri]
MKKLFIFGMGCFIVFFILGTFVWFAIEKGDNQMTEVNRSFDKEDIKQLVVNTDIVNVTFKTGKNFRLHYKGNDKLNITRQGQTLQVVERMYSKRKMLNLNPFETNEGHLIVTIPPDYIENLSVTTRIANIEMQGIKLDNVMLWNDMNGQVTIHDSHFKNTQIKGEETFVNIYQSQLSASDVNVERGLIKADKTSVQQSLFKVGEGDMHLMKMSPQCDLKGVVNKGDITMSYEQLPKDVRLKINPTNGEGAIKDSRLHQGINGNGKHQIELYTNDGDIVVQ